MGQTLLRFPFDNCSVLGPFKNLSLLFLKSSSLALCFLWPTCRKSKGIYYNTHLMLYSKKAKVTWCIKQSFIFLTFENFTLFLSFLMLVTVMYHMLRLDFMASIAVFHRNHLATRPIATAIMLTSGRLTHT